MDFRRDSESYISRISGLDGEKRNFPEMTGIHVFLVSWEIIRISASSEEEEKINRRVRRDRGAFSG